MRGRKVPLEQTFERDRPENMSREQTDFLDPPPLPYVTLCHKFLNPPPPSPTSPYVICCRPVNKRMQYMSTLHLRLFLDFFSFKFPGKNHSH